MTELLSARSFNTKRLSNTSPSRSPKVQQYKATYLQHLQQSVSKSPIRSGKIPQKLIIKRPKILPPLTKTNFKDNEIQSKYEEIRNLFKKV